MAKLAINGGTPVRTRPFHPWPAFDEAEVENIMEVVRSGKWWRMEGDRVTLFERRFAEAHGSKYALAVTNGTAALEIAVACLGIGPGDEVIVPNYTFVATATCVLMSGATPVFADIEDDTYNIDVKDVERKITDRTKAIIPVHFAGMPADIECLLALAEKHGLAVIEDAAHAHGGMYKGKMLGSFARAGCFSFQASKNLTCGEGGAITTGSLELYDAMVSRHSFGRLPGRPWYEHHAMSGNYRMTEMQAALLLAQLDRMEAQAAERAKNAAFLDQALSGIKEFKTMRPPDEATAKRAYHIYLFRYAPGIEGVARERFIQAVQAEGVPLFGGYICPLYRQPLFASQTMPGGGKYGDLNQPAGERAVREAVWMAQNMLLGDGVEDIVGAIEKVTKNADELRSC